MDARLKLENEHINMNFPVTVQTQVWPGFRADVIREAAEIWRANLTVMGEKLQKTKRILAARS